MSKDAGRDSTSRHGTGASDPEGATQALPAHDRGAEPAAGWSQQSDERYAAGDSGGWGGPEGHETGPLPRLRRGDDAPLDTDHDREGADGYGTHAPNGPGESGYGEQHWSETTSGRTSTSTIGSGLGALFDLSFRRSATSTIAPFTYIVLLVFLLLDYMRSIYDYSSAAGQIGPGALGGLVILFVVGLFKIVVLAALARLALELCQHVAEIARSRRGDGEQW